MPSTLRNPPSVQWPELPVIPPGVRFDVPPCPRLPPPACRDPPRRRLAVLARPPRRRHLPRKGRPPSLLHHRQRPLEGPRPRQRLQLAGRPRRPHLPPLLP